MPIPAVVAAANKARKAVDAATGGKATADGKKVLRWAVGGTAGLVVLLTLSVGGPLPSEAGTCGPGALVPSSADLPAPVLAAINALKPDYEAAAVAKNVSWAILAGIDFRESGNDPNRSSLAGEPLGSANPDHPDKVMHTKAEALEATADYLRGLASDVYGVTVTASTGADDMKKALVAYGRGHLWANAGIDPDRSPYAMNGWDDAHQNMRWPDSPAEPLAGMVDTRMGALTIFARLGGPAGACGLSGVDIVALAQRQVGNREDPDGSNMGGSIAPYLGSAASYGEPWCSDFLSWLRREVGRPFTGGVDGGWRIAGVEGAVAWYRANETWVDRDQGNPPQAGDAISFRNMDHIGLVESVDGTTVHTISGNEGNSVSRATYQLSDTAIDGWGR